MTFKKTLLMGLLASTMLAGCNDDDKSSTQAEGTFATKEELNSTIASLNAANADANNAANTRISSLETALGEASKTIAGYQELLTTQDRITRNLVLAVMQPDITQLQSELARRTTRVEGLADLGESALAFEQAAKAFDLSDVSDDNRLAIKSQTRASIV